MKKLKNFEDIFNKLIEEYKGTKVEITAKQDGVIISTYNTIIKDIRIKPLNKIKSKKWDKSEHKIGLIIIKEKKFNKTNIPFMLDFNTMEAIFLKKGVSIKTFNLEFNIVKISSRQKLA